MTEAELLYYYGPSLSSSNFWLSFQYVRLLRVQPFGEAIHSAFQVFLDAKDAGSLVLTHIYLLLGCSIPLWLYPKKYGTPEQPGECWTWKSVCHPQVDCPGSQMPFLFLLSLTFRTELQRTFMKFVMWHILTSKILLGNSLQVREIFGFTLSLTSTPRHQCQLSHQLHQNAETMFSVWFYF